MPLRPVLLPHGVATEFHFRCFRRFRFCRFFRFSFVFTLFFYFLPFFLDSARFRPLPLLIVAPRCRPFWLLDAVRFRRSVVDSGRIPRGLSTQTDAVPARPLVIECGRCCPCLERASSPLASAMTMQLWAYASDTAHKTAPCTSTGGRSISCTSSEI